MGKLAKPAKSATTALHWSCRGCPARLTRGVVSPADAFCRACRDCQTRAAAVAARVNRNAAGDPAYTCGLRRLADRAGY